MKKYIEFCNENGLEPKQGTSLQAYKQSLPINQRLSDAGYKVTEKKWGGWDNGRRMIVDKKGDEVGFLSPLEAVKKLLVVVLLLFALNLQAQCPDFSEHPPHVCEFLEQNYPYASYVEERFAVPTYLTLAVSALETGWGTSKNCVMRNNWFGMKDPYNDDEVWQCYENKLHSFNHFGVLLSLGRYKFLHDIPRDRYTAWAFGLELAGYSSEGYGSELIKIIEGFKLYEL